MKSNAEFAVTRWEVHETETDCNLIIRSTSGQVFYCHINPDKFIDSPTVLEQYLKCLKILQTGEQEIDDFYDDDAYEWLSQSFATLITQLLRSSGMDAVVNPTLAHYLFPSKVYNIQLFAVDDKMGPEVVNSKHHGWINPIIEVDNDFIRELDQWTRSYATSDVQLCYDRPEDSLVKTPKRTIAFNQDGQPVQCFFKQFGLSFGSSHAKKELEAMKKITLAQSRPPPDTFICRLIGVIRENSKIFGMLFAWIDAECVLSKARAAKTPATLRGRWLSQINRSVQWLHEEGIVWGDAKADNVLIDKNENAWIIDFGGSYTPGWVDKDKAETLEGDYQGVGKINEMLRR
ncbi:Ff.00g112380.m01.CDS01 [Fusarium sp. VM40]|nr:Ff.00g112380.m01.CDS01 [Fusarium sp. VM40]